MGPDGGRLMRLINIENVGKKDTEVDPFDDFERQFLG